MRPTRRSVGLIVILCVASLLSTALPAALAADLDADQQKQLRALTSSATQIETNVRLAQDAAGPGADKPSEAKARLARTRLAPPESLLPQVRDALAKLPADHADVVALAKRLDAAEVAIRGLKARLDGASAPPSPAAPGGGKKLDYQQEKLLTDARYYAREVAGLAAALTELVKETDWPLMSRPV